MKSSAFVWGGIPAKERYPDIGMGPLFSLFSEQVGSAQIEP